MKTRYLLLGAGLMLALAACGKAEDPQGAELPANISALMFLEHRYPDLSVEDRATLRNYLMRRFAQENFGMFEGVPGYDPRPRAKTVGEAITDQRAWEQEFGDLMQQVPEMLERMVPGFEFGQGEGGQGNSPDNRPDWDPAPERKSQSI